MNTLLRTSPLLLGAFFAPLAARANFALRDGDAVVFLGDSITAAEPSDYPRFSIEAAVVRAPEVIVLARHGTGSEPIARETWDRLSSLPAVKAGRVHPVDGNLLHRYGPRVVDGLERLARVIHPEVFR